VQVISNLFPIFLGYTIYGGGKRILGIEERNNPPVAVVAMTPDTREVVSKLYTRCTSERVPLMVRTRQTNLKSWDL
jgi:hypothetical protein